MIDSIKPKKKRKRRRRRGYITGIYTSTKTGISSKYRSGWELKYMEWLDRNILVSSWEYESLKIPYLSNKKTGKMRNYIPDFVVHYADGSHIVTEIKPSKRLTQTTVKKKAQFAEQWCTENHYSYLIITEIELKFIGLL